MCSRVVASWNGSRMGVVPCWSCCDVLMCTGRVWHVRVCTFTGVYCTPSVIGGIVLSVGVMQPARAIGGAPAGVFYVWVLCAVDCLLYNLNKVHEGNVLRVSGGALGEPLQFLRHDGEWDG